MASIEFRASLHDRDAIRGLEEIGKAGRTGIARALKRSGTSSETFLARKVSEDTGLGVTFAKREITTSVSVEEGTVRIATAGFRIPLIRFQARGPYPSRGRGRGVTAIRFGQRTLYPHTFIARVFGPLPTGVTSPGHTGVFARTGRARLPIRQKYGPSIATVFGKFLPEAADRGLESLGKNLQHELQYALAQVST
jgi:hypothetical protein